MFFNASAQLAKNYPAMAAAVVTCDAFIGGAPHDAQFTVPELASRLGLDEPQVSSILEKLSLSGVLSRTEASACANCGTLNGRNRTTCTACSQRLTQPTEPVYERKIAPDNPMHPEAATPVEVPARPSASIGIITALDKEFSAVVDVLGLDREWSAAGQGAGRRYKYGEVNAIGGGVHHVVATLLSTPGNNSAAARASQLLAHFPGIPHIVMCGIAGGLPDPNDPDADIRLGDVVVSDASGVVQYDLGKQHEDKFEITNRPRPPSAELLEAAQHLMSGSLLGNYPWEQHLSRADRYPWAARPRDDEGAKPHSTVSYPANPGRRPRFAHLFRGPIASANVVQRSKTRADQLRKEHRVRAVEMEGSGVADATWQGEAGYLVVRGIVDFADGEKGDRWHGYGSFAAASVLRALLEQMHRVAR
jgi:nucleoside phosphorylase